MAQVHVEQHEHSSADGSIAVISTRVYSEPPRLPDTIKRGLSADALPSKLVCPGVAVPYTVVLRPRTSVNPTPGANT